MQSKYSKECANLNSKIAELKKQIREYEKEEEKITPKIAQTFGEDKQNDSINKTVENQSKCPHFNYTREERKSNVDYKVLGKVWASYIAYITSYTCQRCLFKYEEEDAMSLNYFMCE